MRVLTFGFVAILLSACAGASPSAVTSPSPSVVAIASTPPTASPAPQPTPTATPIAVLPGEPWIVYGWSVDGGWYLALMRPDGSDAHKILTEVPGEPKAADWSPDGQTLAFVVKGADYPEGSIWTANADGSGAALLSAGGTECPVGLFHPSWSPDGAKLAVVCYPGGDDREAVAILDIATKSLTRLATFKTPDFLDNAATWSPDGRTIAFDILHWDPTGAFIDGSVVATVPVAGGEIHRLTSPDTFMSHPDWSPDGAELVMGSYDLGNIVSTSKPSNLFVIKPDGSDLRQLTHSSKDGSMRIGGPRWSPDGTRIVVGILTSTGPDFALADVKLAFVDAAGGEPVLISQTDGKNGDLRPTP